MKFYDWYEMREVAGYTNDDMPSSNKVLYTAVVLTKDSQQDLVAAADQNMMLLKGVTIPKNKWIVRCHHMTIKFKPMQNDIETLKDIFGQRVMLSVRAWGLDDHGMAVIVDPNASLPVGQTPHITVAHSRDVSPVYSNTLLSNSSAITMAPEILNLMGVIVCVLPDPTKVWPIVDIPLASQTV